MEEASDKNTIDKTENGKKTQIKRIKKTTVTPLPIELNDNVSLSNKCNQCLSHQRCAKSLLKLLEQMLTTGNQSANSNNSNNGC